MSKAVSPIELKAVHWLLHDLSDEGDGTVEYERVIQTARRELLMDRADVTREVEQLCGHGAVEKVRGDYLRPVSHPRSSTRPAE